jgi:hypothetical protein
MSEKVKPGGTIPRSGSYKVMQERNHAQEYEVTRSIGHYQEKSE